MNDTLNSQPLISIIMPAYNSEAYISTAIESVILQTYSHWELIIVDDCSIDATAQIAISFSKVNPRITYLKNPKNRGVAFSRNTGIKHASGEWLAFLDSDDLWESSKLEKQLKLASSAHALFIFSGSSFMDEKERLLNNYLSTPYKINYRKLLKQNIISCSSVLIKKEIMLPFPQHQSCIHEDFAVWLEILKNNDIFAYSVNEPLLTYRVSTSSKSGNKLKAAKMTYAVYRYIGLSRLQSLYYMCHYTVKSLKKYKRIWIQK